LQIFPTADFSDPAWGTYETADWSIEFDMGDEEICEDFALHVTSRGDAPIAIARLLDHLGLRTLDSGTSQPIESLLPDKQAYGGIRRFHS